MRLARSIGLLGLGAVGGLAGAAVVAKRVLPSRGDVESDDVGLVAIFDGVQLASRSGAFRGGSALAWFGGVDLDLREAALAPGARLTVGAFMGGVAITVPPSWRVEASVNTLAGGVDVSQPDSGDPDAPVLLLEGIACMGGVAVGRRSSGPAAPD